MQQITQELVFSVLPKRDPSAHKGDLGRVLCVCGSPNYRGAAALACLGALRSGAGLVTLAAEERVIQSVCARILEATFVPLPDADGLALAMERATVCLAGCGMENSAETFAQMVLLLQKTSGTFLLDAGGLACFAGREALLRGAKGRLIVTPHLGEMAALLRTRPEAVAAQMGDTARNYAKSTGAVVVLKSNRTVVATPEGALYENTSGNAGLARGGSGDVLAGIIAGLSAIGLSRPVAAICGVYLHGAAADLCARRISMQTMLPEDILHDLGTLFSRVEQLNPAQINRKHKTL